MVDSNDRASIDDEIQTAFDVTCQNSLFKILSEPNLAKIPLLVVSNKRDLPDSLSNQDIINKMKLEEIKDRQWYLQACYAKKGDGIVEGLQWLAEAIKNKNK